MWIEREMGSKAAAAASCFGMLGVLALGSCGGEGTEAAEQPSAVSSTEAEDLGPYMALDSALVARYVETLEALGEAGYDLELGIEQDPPLLESKPKGLRDVEAYVEVLRAHGLDMLSFARLHDNVSLAWFSVESRDPSSRYAEDLAERSAMLKDLRLQLPADQFEAMSGAMLEEQEALEVQLAAVPENNLKAVAAHRVALARYFGS